MEASKALILVMLVSSAQATSLSDQRYGPESNWYLKVAGLYQLEDGRLERGNEGLLIAHFVSPPDEASIWPQYLDGTVCDNSFNDHAANLTCQHLGHKYAIIWGSGPENFHYISKAYLEKADIKILIDDVHCADDSTDIHSCEASIMEKHDCTLGQGLWLKCEKKDWEVHSAQLLRYNEETGRGEEGGEGMVMVTVFDYRTGVAYQGTVCDNGSFNGHAADLACEQLGYKHAAGWGTTPENFNFIPEHMMNAQGPPIVIDGVQCDNGASNIKECKARLLQGVEHDCSYNDNLWLKCIK